MIENINYYGIDYQISSLKKPSKKLTEEDVAFAKALINLGCHLHKIASILGVNPGRIAEIKAGEKFAHVAPASLIFNERDGRMNQLTSEDQEIVKGILKKLEEGDSLRSI